MSDKPQFGSVHSFPLDRIIRKLYDGDEPPGGDDVEARLSISVFGKARDFTVEIGAPKTLSSTPAPADRIIRDASLPAGQRKQVDWAAPGAVIEVTRRFVRDGKTFKQDTLKSSYRPWPNIFAVGTR